MRPFRAEFFVFKLFLYHFALEPVLYMCVSELKHFIVSSMNNRPYRSSGLLFHDSILYQYNSIGFLLLRESSKLSNNQSEKNSVWKFNGES